MDTEHKRLWDRLRERHPIIRESQPEWTPDNVRQLIRALLDPELPLRPPAAPDFTFLEGLPRLSSPAWTHHTDEQQGFLAALNIHPAGPEEEALMADKCARVTPKPFEPVGRARYNDSRGRR